MFFIRWCESPLLQRIEDMFREEWVVAYSLDLDYAAILSDFNVRDGCTRHPSVARNARVSRGDEADQGGSGALLFCAQAETHWTLTIATTHTFREKVSLTDLHLAP